MAGLTLQSFQLKNFKAIQDSGPIQFTPLTAFIGNNGVGKSSVIEGLEFIQTVVEQSLDRAAQEWRGFEYIWNQGVSHQEVKQHDPSKRPYFSNPMSFSLRGQVSNLEFTSQMKITTESGETDLFFKCEEVLLKDTKGGYRKIVRNDYDKVIEQTKEDEHSEIGPEIKTNIREDISIFSKLRAGIPDWQFVSLEPRLMGSPIPQKQTSGRIRLAKDGSNIAEYLLDIRKIDAQAFDGIVEVLQAVLPYARDFYPAFTSELERAAYLQMSEGQHKVPGWLLSTGTLRIIALLAVLRYPTPPTLIVIEEIENGLDPRSIHLIIEEMRIAIEANKTQIILTTHSPYLLDLLTLSQIILVERVSEQPSFTRPGDDETLKKWAKKYAPGQLYTMGRLSKVS